MQLLSLLLCEYPTDRGGYVPSLGLLCREEEEVGGRYTTHSLHYRGLFLPTTVTTMVCTRTRKSMYGIGTVYDRSNVSGRLMGVEIIMPYLTCGWF